jgi:hypothetical protein
MSVLVKDLARAFIEERRTSRPTGLYGHNEFPIDDEPWVRWLSMQRNFEAPAWATHFIAEDRVERFQPHAYTFTNTMKLSFGDAATKEGQAQNFVQAASNLARSLRLNAFALAQMRCDYVYCHTDWDAIQAHSDKHGIYFELAFIMYGGPISPMEWRRRGIKQRRAWRRY